MSARLNWIDVLNEQATWTSYEDLIAWFSGLIGQPVSLSQPIMEDFQNGLNFIRRQLSAVHFHEPVDIAGLDVRLRDVRLELVENRSANDGYSAVLPTLRGRWQSEEPDAILCALKETLTVQFAFFVAGALDDSENPGIARCEGLYRKGSSTHLSPVVSFPAEIELRWRKEISVLTESGLESSPEILRCADFFSARAKARFCSDDCRFRTFQLTKQLSDPGYLAAKQKRYRQRQDKR